MVCYACVFVGEFLRLVPIPRLLHVRSVGCFSPFRFYMYQPVIGSPGIYVSLAQRTCASPAPRCAPIFQRPGQGQNINPDDGAEGIYSNDTVPTVSLKTRLAMYI